MRKRGTCAVDYDPAQLFILERLPITDFNGPPRESGVYLVCVRELVGYGKYGREKVMYVGSSNCILNRVSMEGHPLQVLRSKYNENAAVFTRTLVCKDYLSKEVQMIRLFRPPMNKQHNG